MNIIMYNLRLKFGSDGGIYTHAVFVTENIFSARGGLRTDEHRLERYRQKTRRGYLKRDRGGFASGCGVVG